MAWKRSGVQFPSAPRVSEEPAQNVKSGALHQQRPFIPYCSAGIGYCCSVRVYRKAALGVAGALLASLGAGTGASAGFFDELDGAVYSFFSDGWLDWEILTDLGDIAFEPGSGSSALLIAVPSPEFIDIVDFGCVDIQPVTGDEFDFSFVIDANDCVGIGGASVLAPMMDEDFIPLAGFLWLAFNEEGEPIFFDCLEARGSVNSGGVIDADLGFEEFDPLRSSGAARELPSIESLSRSMETLSSRRAERTSLNDTSFVWFVLGADPTADLDDDTPGDEDAVWSLDIRFSSCVDGESFKGLDIDHYRGRAEQGQLPNTN